MRCSMCDRTERPCAYTQRTRSIYRILIRAIRYRAERCGYAIAQHGSLKTDIDLVAIPWREGAIDAAYLAEQIRLTVEQIVGFAFSPSGDAEPVRKPHGRLGWAFYLQPLDVPGPYIDLSVMPRAND